MFAVGNNPSSAHNYFQDFWKCLSIFNKSTKLQKKIEKETKWENLPDAVHQAHLPAQPSCRASELLGLARQAARCSTASSGRATHLAAALLHLLAASPPWMASTSSPRPPGHAIRPSVSLPHFPSPWPTPPSPLRHRSRSHRRPRAAPPCQIDSPSSTSSN